MNIIELSNLTFHWPNQTELTIDIPFFTQKQGNKLFIKGPSGSGKSTLLSLLTGILSPTSGCVNINGTDINQLSSNQRDRFRADNIGYIFQQFNLLPYLSVIDNVILPYQFSSKKTLSIKELRLEATRLLTQLQLPASHFNKPITDLSIGQQQRVAAARAFIGKPKLIIADEPTSALDHETRFAFIELLMNECENSNASLLFVSHDPSLESLFDQSIDLRELNKAGEIS
ncbi:ABC transporter ATP-binding protein [Aliivibrio fischeri]|uniref:ABC transporter ATP-binding protein n=1 Tax=Aliivibrio fischeri TaxID=668 RepID=UPI0012D9A33A|nr:ABC transporter ATP-binding protein [Aliivibrio fischeri]MUK63610.1 ATP-binding cassette domain-containing protein [Aliivibrio fischeri]MUL22487.1 ATP-binding cassette domain-containing protein [Aliivibrio fischeri]MUL26577.1 ATP-binding cassette domain-containing protein [Aliivibrio fischeri]